jgi:RNA polymerase sigma factor (sigma-70 family)
LIIHKTVSFKGLDNITHIIEGCKKQDRQCQEKLYRQFYPAMFALCKKFFSDKHDILTALNNGMLRMFKNIDQYDSSKGDFFNWVYTIVRNAALTLVRDKKDNHTLELTEDFHEAADNNPFKKFEWKDIYYYLDKLPPKTRCVCNLFYFEDFSIKEIAASINMKEGAVKWHLGECRSRLKTIFEQHNLKKIE